MVSVLVVAFLGVFSVASLLMWAVSPGKSGEAKQMQATLDSALAIETPVVREQFVDVRKTATVSTIPWLNKKLSQLQVTPALARLLHQADLKWTPGMLIVGTCAAFAVTVWLVHLKISSALISLAVGVVAGCAPIAWVMFQRGRRFNKFVEGLPEALEMMVSALRVGHSLVAAMGLVGRECSDPIGGEFKTCFEEQNYGLELKSALDNMLKRAPIQDLRIVCTAILIQKESGGNLSEVLDKTAHVIRERFRLKRQVGVHTAQGRLTGIILSLMPVALGVLFYMMSPEQMRIMWTDPLGIKLLWGGIGLQVLGAVLIRKIVDIDI
jgi:tight adherence protein B